MNQRFVKPGMTAAREAGTGIFHPTLVHPLTGESLEAVGVGKNGDIWWPILGGAEPGDETNPEDDDDKDDDADDDTKDDDSADDDDDEKDPKAKIAALEEEKNRHYKRRKKAETELAAVKAELAALKAKPTKKAKPKATETDETDDEPADDEEKVTLRADNEKAKTEARRLKVENAFLRVNAVDWVNPTQVMTLLMSDDDYEVEFDEHGNVDRKSLAAELKRFAKANTHLVKPKQKKSSEDGDDDTTDSSEKSSGSTMNGQRKGKAKKEPTREELARKYPALKL
jgi:hypothetical protein